MQVTAHALQPHAAPVVVRHVGVGHVQVGGLLDAGRDLEEQLGLDLLGGGEGDEHVVAGGHDALRPGEVVDGHVLDEPAGGVGAVPHLEEGAVVLAGHEVDEVQGEDVAAPRVQLLPAGPGHGDG